MDKLNLDLATVDLRGKHGLVLGGANDRSIAMTGDVGYVGYVDAGYPVMG